MAEVGRVAQTVGLSTKALQEYRIAAEKVGVASADLDEIMKRLAVSVGQARLDNAERQGDAANAAKGKSSGNLEEAIARLVLRDLMEQQDEEEKGPDSVQLMTLHASKGLEYPHVFIIGMEEKLLPHRASIEDGNIEEERRLAYVGITRAQQTLTMTMASKRRQFGETLDCEQSRFIEELPQEDLTFQGGGEATEEENAIVSLLWFALE